LLTNISTVSSKEPSPKSIRGAAMRPVNVFSILLCLLVVNLVSGQGGTRTEISSGPFKGVDNIQGQDFLIISRLDERGVEWATTSFKITSNCKITLDGKVVSLNSLPKGCMVTATVVRPLKQPGRTVTVSAISGKKQGTVAQAGKQK